jgi:uncharacterized protein with PQ loop repeat
VLADSEIIGLVATVYGVGGSLSILLQARQILARRASGDVSLRFLTLYVGGYAVWLLYGFSLASLPMIVVHSLGLACGAATLGVAMRFRDAASAGGH